MFITKVRTALNLGIINIIRVIVYRLSIRIGINPVQRLKAPPIKGDFFRSYTDEAYNLPTNNDWANGVTLFSYWHLQSSTDIPIWHANPFTGKKAKSNHLPWWKIPDFDPNVGDIKQIWELSRFDWALAFAQKAANGNEEYLHKLNQWINDWYINNPPYLGINWKCGQEASIRVMHLAVCALILKQTKNSNSPLLDLIAVHLERIAPTIQYAVAQDNNHGTSEAAALFIGGSWLEKNNVPKGADWKRLGKKWLENRAQKLILKDGSFSQYSLTYHRLMLDTISLSEIWRIKMNEPKFKPKFYQRAQAACDWLYCIINLENGDGPNLGANDGARLLPLTNTNYRDFRPSLQLAMRAFKNQNAITQPGPWNNVLKWLSIEPVTAPAPPQKSKLFDSGGYAILHKKDAMVLFRYPRFRFRPSQADALHIDLWVRGKNLLRDGGSYSYNAEEKWLNYFPCTISHNTVQFDNRSQMPRISRFLYGDWLKTKDLSSITESNGCINVAASYKDAEGSVHSRSIELNENSLKVRDEIKGLKHSAILRWRLKPGDWKISKHSIKNKNHIISIQSTMPIKRFEVIEGWESKYYLDKQPIPVLEVEVHEAGALTTEYQWN